MKKKFEAIAEKSVTKLKRRKKSGHFAEIKRQANPGLEGILREGRGLLAPRLPLSKKKRKNIDKL